MFISHTENHWQTVSSPEDFMVFSDLKLNPGEERKDWIFVLDLASIHRAAEFRAKVSRPHSTSPHTPEENTRGVGREGDAPRSEQNRPPEAGVET